jgi:hypothetical protein
MGIKKLLQNFLNDSVKISFFCRYLFKFVLIPKKNLCCEFFSHSRGSNKINKLSLSCCRQRSAAGISSGAYISFA